MGFVTVKFKDVTEWQKRVYRGFAVGRDEDGDFAYLVPDDIPIGVVQEVTVQPDGSQRVVVRLNGVAQMNGPEKLTDAEYEALHDLLTDFNVPDSLCRKVLEAMKPQLQQYQYDTIDELRFSDLTAGDWQE